MATPPLLRDEATFGYRMAHGLAYAVNPLVLPPLLFGLVLAHFGAPAAEVAWAVAVALVGCGLVPLAYVVYLVRRRRVASVEVRDRAQRTGPFVVGLASSGLALALLAGTGTTAAALVGALAACLVVNMAVVVVVNLRWKISVHAAALAGFISILAFVARDAGASGAAGGVLSPGPLAGLLPLLGLVMWARVRTGAHTAGQVAAGALLGLALPYAELHLLRHLGLLAGL